MSSVELKSERARQGDGSDVPRRAAGDPDNVRSRIRVAPILITLGTVAVAAFLAWATWQTYMGAPWTRDGTVRAYVVTMAPEVAGRIVKLSVADNEFVHKDDDLFEIDPADYRIALEQAQAQAQRRRTRLYPRERQPKSHSRETRLDLHRHLPANHEHAASIGGSRRFGQGRHCQGAARPQAHRDPFSGERVCDQFAGATWRLCHHRSTANFSRRRRYLLGRRLLRGDQ